MKDSHLPHLVESLDQFTGGCQQPGAGVGFALFPPVAQEGYLCPFFDILNNVEQLIE